MTRTLFFGLVFSLSLLSVYSQAPSISVQADIATSAVPVQVLYANGQYISVFSPLQLYSSTDGHNWTPIAAPAVSLNGKLAYGAGRYVCVTDGGKIYSSTDLVSWTVYNSPVGAIGYQTDVQFLNGAFYITGFVGNGSTLLHSADGISWDQVNVSSDMGTNYYYGIAYANGLFVINDYVLTGTKIYTSPSGQSGTWTLASSVDVGSAGNLKFQGSHFYLFGTGAALFSDDAITWSPVVFSGGTPPAYASGIYYGTSIFIGGLYYLVGYGQSGTPPNIYGSLYTSEDGITFYNGPIQQPYPSSDAVFVNNLFFLFSFSQMEVADDGLLYTPMGRIHRGVAFDGHRYVNVGEIGVLESVYSYGFVRNSTDFVSWTTSTSGTDKFGNPTGLQIAANTVLWDSSRFLVFADSAAFSSADGVDFQYLGRPPLARMVAYGGGTYVLLGDSLCYSHDAVHWTRAAVPGGIRKVRYVKDAFYAVGENNPGQTPLLLRSTNGADWLSVPIVLSSPNGSFEDLLYDGTKYCLIGSGLVPDGSTRSFFSVVFDDINNPNSGTFVEGGVSGLPDGVRLVGYGDEAFAYNNGHFVGGMVDFNHNGDGYLVYSSDGVSWNYSRLNAYTTINAIVASGGTFRMTGTNDVLVTASFGGGTLPVTLLDFEAVASGSRSLLTWKTGVESNSSRFVVQRSVDGVHWDSIGMVAAAGNSTTSRDYQFVDVAAVAGYDDYRLALADRDGGRQLSVVKRVYIGSAAASPRVYPNPAGDVVNVELPGVEGVKVVALYNATGALVYRLEMGGSTMTLSLRGLPAGVYQLVIDGPNGWQLRREVMHH